MPPGIRMLGVAENRAETASTRTMRFRGSMDARPGQFVMVWVPGVDEFPMSLSYMGEGFGITYQVVGEGTRALARVAEGGLIGVRGPFGRGFELNGDRMLVVAGGAGIAPTAPLVESAAGKGASVDLVLGARSAGELVFERRCADAGAAVHVSTDDGSRGRRGLATELAAELVAKGRYDQVYACGPERMLVGVVALCREKGLPLQASVERIMKCGIGVCDSCAIDGKHVCTDGPVFDLAELGRLSELGRTRLDRSGRKVGI